jgi:hypothetical protein
MLGIHVKIQTMNSKKPTVEILLKESYLSVIENSVDSTLFQHYYAKVNGKKEEVLQNGDKSCAFFVTSLLVLFNLLPHTELTVHRAILAMKQHGWVEIHRPRKGCILVWKEKEFGTNNPRKHIGFYIGSGLAVSNSSKKKTPQKHSYKEFNGRGIETMLWHQSLS